MQKTIGYIMSTFSIIMFSLYFANCNYWFSLMWLPLIYMDMSTIARAHVSEELSAEISALMRKIKRPQLFYWEEG